MNLAPRSQTGLALGAWGAAQASAAGLAIALGGIIRDVVYRVHCAVMGWGRQMAYDAVYGIEVVLLLATLVTMRPLIRPRTGIVPEPARQPFHARRAPSLVELERP